MDIRKRIEDLIGLIDKYNKAYYQNNESLISDESFDQLMYELQKLEQENPLLAFPNSPTQKVGGTITKQFKSVSHRFPMLSLGNTYNENDLKEFDSRIKRTLGEENYEYICELKFDGVALSLWYQDGILIKGVTRGDGIRGDDITNNVKTIATIPKVIQKSGLPVEFELRGEGFMPNHIFESINFERRLSGESLLANPRNSASGTFKMQNSSIVAKRNLDCFVYSFLGFDNPFQTHEESLIKLYDLGFPVSQTWEKCADIESVFKYIHNWAIKRNELPLNTDGIVIKINDLGQQERLGFTAKSPRWAISFKYPSEIARTEIINISYQVGRTGNITPVANLKPVYLAGTMIKRASIHNANEMLRLDLHEGDFVFVEKGGEIIPKITGVDKLARNPLSTPFIFPTNCPDCHSKLIRLEGGANHYCVNEVSCPTQNKGKIEHFIQRKALNIENIGEETIDLLFEKLIIKDVGDLYTLSSKDFIGLDGFQNKSIQNILSSIEKSKLVSFRKVLFGLGIRHVGVTIAEKLVLKYKSIYNLMDASYDDLIAVPEIGESIAISIIAFFKRAENLDLLKRLEGYNVQLSEQIIDIELESLRFKDKNFVISGVFLNFDRDSLKDKIILNGGKVVSSISSKLDYLVAGDNMGPSKLEKANQLSIKIITEDEFLNLLT